VRGPRGGRAAVLVDGVKRATVSFFALQPTFRVKLFTSKALSAGAHTVRVNVLGTKVKKTKAKPKRKVKVKRKVKAKPKHKAKVKRKPAAKKKTSSRKPASSSRGRS